ncbi:HEAT repeat domain-containing protein [Leptolyngbyaceae cyanobacterium CCMR0082]|uniref:HEAT repeat domain-containing protein n=2 Tax=Adonisia turfae TaxID=2950184 RepID=A0A6M0SFR8_9CYAN|nr:HEAT repeat domain-containing protein [Adonisia turfae]MDV3352621.1 HEAT repeat domain-containing protein [Leptothoe sp. LEGE 181152]NEZ59092.1 HEAT repeat domain-containing protein [Adonisia turfae CCMR0081]NEZ67369.1 HEAT repeat domain-containing protein [Adonisia turfae CCMR0082]
MELSDIQAILEHPDSQERLKGIVALKDYDADTASPLLLSKKDDPEFLVRSFVAMGLGRKRSDTGFEALLAMIDNDPDANVRAEASNSLAMYGDASIPHLVKTFHGNSNWLIRRSILAAMIDLNSPTNMLDICLAAIIDSDLTVINAGIDHLSTLANTHQAEAALAAILPLKTAENWYTRMHVAYALKRFDAPAAKEALIELRQDQQHKVVAAALEGLVP